MRIIVVPGDGIGPEITEATVRVLEAASDRFGLDLALVPELAGFASLQRHGDTVRPELVEIVKAADGLLLGPLSTYQFTGTGEQRNPSALFRKGLDLYANMRPSRTYKGVRPLTGVEFDLVVARENTEGFYADRNMAEGNAEILVTEDVVISMRRITRLCSERIGRAACRLARTRRGKVSLVHKANVLRRGDGLFLESCRKVQREEFPDVTLEEVIVDAMAAHLVRRPQEFDVICTTNMFGDILSDLAAELSGSIGLGGSLNSGDRYAMAQAAHGSAPDIAGQDRANPVSLVLSAAQLLAWHGERSGRNAFAAAASAIERAVEAAVISGEATRDVGGRFGTRETGEALARLVATP